MTKQSSIVFDLSRFVRNVMTKLPPLNKETVYLDPFSLFQELPAILKKREEEQIKRTGTGFESGWQIPSFDFYYTRKNGKSRLIGNPNVTMRELHKLFVKFLREHMKVFASLDTHDFVRNYFARLHLLPSSSAFVSGRDVLNYNVIKHQRNDYFYILDIRRAYDELNTDLLALMLTALLLYEEYLTGVTEFFHQLKFGIKNELLLDEIFAHPLLPRMKRFIDRFCRASSGRGIITGAVASPYLFNLYCEMALDNGLRYLFQTAKHDQKEVFTYSRFADDGVISSNRPVWSHLRKEIRSYFACAGFAVNHRKSRVLYRRQGTVSITGFGLSDDSNQQPIVTFPQCKRRKLQGMLRKYILFGKGNVEVIKGYIAEFKYYLFRGGNSSLTKSDGKMIALYNQFEHSVFKRTNTS